MSNTRELKELLGRGKVDRREFIKRAAALGISATAAGALMNSAQAANKGGHYIQALTGGGTGDVLDPAQTLDSYMINVSFGQLRNNLTEIAPDGNLRPELAESWEATPDAVNWTFKLRKGVQFHNGKSMTAADVVASFNHHRGEDTKSAAKGLMKAVVDIKADGDHVVKVTLDGGNADFPVLASDYHLTICPANADGSIDWQSGTGTGGYVLEKFEPGVTSVVKRNPNYWKENAAYFDSVENLFIADSNARTSAVMTGEIHSMVNLDLATVHLLKRNKNVQVLQDKTIVIFTSDHGYHLGEHDFWAKVSLREESAAVPLIISVPGKEPAVCHSLTELLDLYPTISALCGLEVPERLQGKDLSPLLDDPQATVREAAFSVAPSRRGFLLREDKWAYIQYEEDASAGSELFDMQRDPKQYTNLAEMPEYAGVAQEFRAKLADKMREVRDNDLRLDNAGGND